MVRVGESRVKLREFGRKCRDRYGRMAATFRISVDTDAALADADRELTTRS
jgi:hypothetical protein